MVVSAHKGFVARKTPQFMASKRKRKVEVVDPQMTHRELKLYLLRQRLMVERSALPERRKQVRALDNYLAYLRSLEK